jgi:hypothetical protein
VTGANTILHLSQWLPWLITGTVPWLVQCNPSFAWGDYHCIYTFVTPPFLAKYAGCLALGYTFLCCPLMLQS